VPVGRVSLGGLFKLMARLSIRVAFFPGVTSMSFRYCGVQVLRSASYRAICWIRLVTGVTTRGPSSTRPWLGRSRSSGSAAVASPSPPSVGACTSRPASPATLRICGGYSPAWLRLDELVARRGQREPEKIPCARARATKYRYGHRIDR
jgi:hypothetical protein